MQLTLLTRRPPGGDAAVRRRRVRLPGERSRQDLGLVARIGPVFDALASITDLPGRDVADGPDVFGTGAADAVAEHSVVEFDSRTIEPSRDRDPESACDRNLGIVLHGEQRKSVHLFCLDVSVVERGDHGFARQLPFTATGAQLRDASGLSTDDRISAHLIDQVLTAAAGPDTPELRPLLDTLPVAGFRLHVDSDRFLGTVEPHEV